MSKGIIAVVVIALLVFIGNYKRCAIEKEMKEGDDMLADLKKRSEQKPVNTEKLTSYCYISTKKKFNVNLFYPCGWKKIQSDDIARMGIYYNKIENGAASLSVSFDAVYVGDVFTDEYIKQISTEKFIKNMYGKGEFISSFPISLKGIKGVKIMSKEKESDINKRSLTYNFFYKEHILSIKYDAMSKDAGYAEEKFKEYESEFNVLYNKTTFFN